MIDRLRRLLSYPLDAQAIRYFFAGLWNTVFGYIVGLLLYHYYGTKIGVFFVGILANIFAITMSFLTYKLFVFRTIGNWWKEYLKAYFVYGTSAFLGILLLTFFVDILKFEFWIAQGVVIVLGVLISYFGHKLFTFKN